MTSNDFLDVLGKVDDAFVEEAAVAGAYLPSERQVTNHRHTKRIWLVAAAFALVVLSCASWLMLRKGPDPGAAPSDDPRLAGTSSAPVATAPNMRCRCAVPPASSRSSTKNAMTQRQSFFGEPIWQH